MIQSIHPTILVTKVACTGKCMCTVPRISHLECPYDRNILEPTSQHYFAGGRRIAPFLRRPETDTIREKHGVSDDSPIRIEDS